MESTKMSKGMITAIGVIAVCFSSLSVAVAFFAYEARKNRAEKKQLQTQVEMVRDYLNKMEDSMVTMQNYRSSIEDLTRTPLVEDGNEERSLEDSIGRFIDTYKSRSTLEDHSRPVSQRLATLKESTVQMEQTLRVLNTVLGHSKDFLEAIPSITPVDGWMTSHFGERVSPFTGKEVVHLGLDIGAREGSPVAATADGKVLYAGVSATYGKIVILQHGFNIQTRYAHNSKLLVRRGQKVKRGQKIALVGNTGRSTGSHLHYEVWVNSKPVDPANYLIDRIQDTTLAKTSLSLMASTQIGGEETAAEEMGGTDEGLVSVPVRPDNGAIELNDDAVVARASSEVKIIDWRKTAGVGLVSFGLMLFALIFGYLIYQKARRDMAFASPVGAVRPTLRRGQVQQNYATRIRA